MSESKQFDSASAELEALVRERTEELEAANQALREIEARFQAVYDHHYQLTGLLDTEGRLLMANRSALDFAGVGEQDILGKLFVDTPYWNHSREAQDELRRAIEQARAGEFVRFETTHISSSGEARDFDFCISPVRDAEGKVIYMVPEGHDITDRKRTEAELREREETIRALVETSQDLIWAFSLQGVVTYCNPAAQDILGYPPDTLVGTRAFDLFHPEDRARVETILPDCVAHRHGWKNLRTRWRTREGSWRHLESNAVPVLDEGGRLEGFRAVDRDITERIEAEKALRASEEKYRTFFKNSCDPMAILCAGVFIDYNTSALTLLGYDDPAELSGKGPGDISPPNQPDGRRSADLAPEIMEIARREGTHRFEWAHLHRDGSVVPVEVVLTAVPADGELLLHAVWRDLRGRRSGS